MNDKMSRREWRFFKEAIKKEKAFNEHRYYCSNCGHSLVIGVNVVNKLCSHCGRLVFKDRELQEIYNREIEAREAKMDFKKELRKYL